MPAERCLAGFTTVRNLGDRANEVAALRNAINAGVVPGPRILYVWASHRLGPGDTQITLTATAMTSRAIPGPVEGIINSPERCHQKRFECITRRATTSSRSCPPAACWIRARAGDNAQMTLDEIRGRGQHRARLRPSASRHMRMVPRAISPCRHRRSGFDRARYVHGTKQI